MSNKSERKEVFIGLSIDIDDAEEFRKICSAHRVRAIGSPVTKVVIEENSTELEFFALAIGSVVSGPSKAVSSLINDLATIEVP